MQCIAIGVESGARCKRGASPGEWLCAVHLEHRPTLPPGERTTYSELIDELIACHTPPEKEAPASRTVDPADYAKSPENYIVFCGGTLALRCKAMSKRTKQRCKRAASKEKFVCRYHGGASTGPRTPEGLKRLAGANTVHGRETRAIRRRRKQKFAELRVVARVIDEYGF